MMADSKQDEISECRPHIDRGSILKMYNKYTNIKPRLQVLDIKPIQHYSRNKKRYKLKISDGQHYMIAMLSIQCINNLENFDIIDVDEWTVCTVSRKKVCILVNCHVVSKYHKKIGLPVAANTDRESEKPLVSVPEWLSARYLLRTLDTDIIESCYDDILKSFENKMDIISTLVKASSVKQIKLIIKILKDAQSKQIEANNHKIINEYYQDTEKSYFDHLSEESIFGICQYLERNDLMNFKMTSTFNSLIVFEIMKGYKVGVFNMNELIEHKQYKYSLHLSLYNKIKRHSVKPFTRNDSLINMYSKRYDIEINNMLLLQPIDINTVFTAQIIENVYNFKELQITKDRPLLVLDKNKILTLNNKDELKLMPEISNLLLMEQMNDNYGVVLLQYFDFEQQRIQNIQYLWFDSLTKLSRIQKYIEKDLLSIINKIYSHLSCSWCHRLIYTMNKMKEYGNYFDCNLIKAYHRSLPRDSKDLIWGDTNQYNECNEYVEGHNHNYFRVIIFELNQNHPYFQANRHILPSKLLEPFHCGLRDYITDQTAKYELNVTYCDEEDVLKHEIEHFDTDNAVKIFPTDIKVSITPLSTFTMIREQISKVFNYVIPSKHIQIYKYMMRTPAKIDEWSVVEKQRQNVADINSEEQQFANNLLRFTDKYKYNIVTYNTLLYDIYHIYNICIYEDSIQQSQIFKFPQKYNDRMFINFNNFEQENQFKDDKDNNNDNDNDDDDDNKWNQNELDPHRFMMNMKDIISNNNNSNDNDNTLNENKWLFPNNNYKTNEKLRFKVDAFMMNMMDIISNPMYGDKYKSIINKYKHKDNYSFIIMDKEDIKKKQFKCFEGNDEYIHYTSLKKINFYDINILITRPIMIINDGDDDNKIDNDDDRKQLFAVIVRFNKEKQFDFGFKSENIGFPIKLLISKQCTPSMIVKQYFNENETFIFYSCSSINGNIDQNESIYINLCGDNMEEKQSMNNKSWQLLISGDMKTEKSFWTTSNATFQFT